MLLRVLGLAGGYPGFEFAGSFGQFFRYFSEELGGAFFSLGSDFFFNVLAEAGQFFVETAAQFFKFVHKVPHRYERRDSGIIETLDKSCKEESWPFPIIGKCAWNA